MATVTDDPERIATQVPARLRAKRKPKGEAPLPTLGADAPAVDGNAGKEIGASGTVNMMGIISGVELNARLVPPEGLKVYDEMRNLAQVHASLYIVKAPILSSTPVVRPPKDGDATDQAIADFCQASLFKPRSMRISWRRVFEHLLTRLDYGVSVSEKVWQYDHETGTWRLRKIAPRLAPTLWGWEQDKDGELVHVIQQAFKPDLSYTTMPMPAAKCLISSHQREGDNYWGRSILRSAYFHWWALTEMLRIGVVRADRWGVGIPKAKFTSVDAWANTKLVNQVKKALKALRSHEKAWVMEHPEVEFSMLQMNGTDGGVKLSDDIEFHAKMIIQNVLATFLSGQADGMSTNRTSKLADIFSSVLELVAGDIAEDLDEQVIAELCDLNFVMAGREYPHVEFTNIADTDLEALADQVGRLAAIGFITPSAEDEDFFREQYKLPPRAADAPTPPGPPEDPGVDPNADPNDNPDAADDETPALRLKDDGRLLGRAPTSVETFCLRAPETYARNLNQTALALEKRLTAIRKLQFDKLAEAIVKRDARTTTKAFTDLRPDNFTIPEKGLVKQALRKTHQAAFADGRRKIRQELARQGATVPLRMTQDVDEWNVLELAGKKKPQPTLPNTASAATSALSTSASVTAERLNDAWFNRVLDVATRLRRTGVRGQGLVTEMWKALENELSSGLRGTARAEVNEAFGLGRGVEAQINEDDIEKAVWSCLLDVDACQPCIDRDGTEATLDSQEYADNPVPYKNCDGNKGGGDACRCQWLYLAKDRTV
ncbi:MAG: DUF935 family protein [Acidobacteriota bacterium]